MIWANAIVLGVGGALLTLPVVLHFLMQPKPKLLEFPALRFVRKRQLANKSRMRLRHIVLLILRCLLILLMAAALAGPSVASREFGQWVTLGGVGISALVVALALATVFFGSEKRNSLLLGLLSVLMLAHVAYIGWAGVRLINSESTQLIGDSAAPVSALILFDNSFRMDYQKENQSNLDRAKELGKWLIEQLPADSQACVLSTDNDVPFYSVDLGAASNRVENLEIVFGSMSLPDRLADGLKLFDEAEHERKEIYILSDLARKSWESTRDTLRTQIEQDPALSIFVLDVGQTDVRNFSLGPLELERQSLPQNGEIRVAATVDRTGAAEQRTIRFRIERQDRTRPVIRDRQVLVPDSYVERTKVINIGTNSSEDIAFTFSEKLAAGIHHGSVEIVGDDALSHDNIRYFTVEVRDAWELLVVHGNGVTPDNLTEAVVDDESSLFKCTIISQDDLPGSFDDYQAVVFLDPHPGIPETTWSNLEKYVASGHGVGIFLGANAAEGATGHPSFQSPRAQRILTGRVDRQWRRPNADLFLSPDNLSHPIFKPFRKWETAVPWNDFPVFIHWSIAADDDWNEMPTKSVLRFGNGKPALIEREIGEGTVMVMTTPITEAAQMTGRDPWNYLFTGYPIPAWLLVREVAEYLVQSQSDRLNLNVDEFASLRNNFRIHPNEYRIFTPRTTSNAEKLTASDNSVKYRFTGNPGHYRLRGSLEETVLRGFSVNIAPGETDLQRLEPADIDAILGVDNYQLATERQQIQRQQGQTRRGQEFYPLLLLILVVVLGVEYLLSTRFYH